MYSSAIEWCSLVIIVFVATVASQPEQCTLPNGRKGNCIDIRRCKYGIAQIMTGNVSPTCEFNTINPKICCANDRSHQYGQISKQKCEAIKQFRLVTEGPTRTYINGGHNAQPTDYTHMTALGFGEQDDIKWFCGGSLISDRHILTAAHCLEPISLGRVRWARLGDLDLKNEINGESPQDFQILERIPHPDYVPLQKYNDIAILVLDRLVQFNKYVAPACLHVDDPLKTQVLHATGWGLLEYDGEQSNRLQEVTLSLYSKAACKAIYRIYPGGRNLKYGIVNSQLCAGGVDRIKDTCAGDSGGPLQYQNADIQSKNEGYTVCGIINFGKICGLPNIPGVYTRVSYYIPWIESVVWPTYQ